MKKRTPSRILIVDILGICWVFRRTLRTYDVVDASTAEEARQILEQDRRFDLILCEVMQPDMSAQELHAWLASVDQALANRIVFLTTGDFSEPHCDFLRDLPNKRIKKPIADLKKHLSELLSGS